MYRSYAHSKVFFKKAEYKLKLKRSAKIVDKILDNQDNIEQSGCNMLKIIIMLGTFVVTVNVLFIWYAKRRSLNTNPDKSAIFTKDSSSDHTGFLNSKEGKKLKQSAATESDQNPARLSGADTWLVNLDPALNAGAFDHVVAGPAGTTLPRLLGIDV